MKTSVNIQSLASYAVMKTLYKDNKNLYTVVGAFVDQLILKRHILQPFTPNQLSEWMREEYGMSIPLTILIKVCKEEKYTNLVYIESRESIIPDTIKLSQNIDNSIQAQIDAELGKDNELLSIVYTCISKHINRDLSTEDIAQINQSFCAFFMDVPYHYEYETLVCDCILDIQEKGTEDQKLQLKSIKEGLLLRLGLTYQSDYSNFNIEELHIYLDTEIIFDALGYNGEIWQELFNDFLDQVRIVNRRKGKCIQLHYFDKTKCDIDDFFTATRHIADNNISPAMRTIIEQSLSSAAGIDGVYADCFENLHRLLITQEKNPTENKSIEEAYVLDYHELKTKFPEIDGDKFEEAYNFLNYIQYLRKGRKTSNFTLVKHIFLTGTRLIRRMSNVIANDENGTKSVPLAVNMDFITAKLWFANNRGLSDQSNLHMLDAACKARVILAMNQKTAVSEMVTKLSDEAKKEGWTKEHIDMMRSVAMDEMKYPEEINNSSDVPSFEYLKSAIEDLRTSKEKDQKHKQEIELMTQQIASTSTALLQANQDKDFLSNKLYSDYLSNVKASYERSIRSYTLKRKIIVWTQIVWTYFWKLLFYMLFFILFGISLIGINKLKDAQPSFTELIPTWCNFIISAILASLPYLITWWVKDNFKSLFDLKYGHIREKLENEFEKKHPRPHLKEMSKEEFILSLKNNN